MLTDDETALCTLAEWKELPVIKEGQMLFVGAQFKNDDGRTHLEVTAFGVVKTRELLVIPR